MYETFCRIYRMGSERVILERRFVPKGALIIEQGDQAWCAYLIQSGRVSVYYEDEGHKVELAQLGSGQICGEMALLRDEPTHRVANVSALEDCNLIVITHNTFQEKLRASDPTIKAVLQMLADRIISSNEVVLDKKADPLSLINIIKRTYTSIHSNISEQKRSVFAKKVEPKMNEFIRSLEAFIKK